MQRRSKLSNKLKILFKAYSKMFEFNNKLVENSGAFLRDLDKRIICIES